MIMNLEACASAPDHQHPPTDMIRNVDIREKLCQMSVLDIVKTRQEKWKARMEEMNRERTTRKIYEGEMGGKRPRGRPRMRWTDNFK